MSEESSVVKTKRHVTKHKKKYSFGAAFTTIIPILFLVAPRLCKSLDNELAQDVCALVVSGLAAEYGDVNAIPVEHVQAAPDEPEQPSSDSPQPDAP